MSMYKAIQDFPKQFAYEPEVKNPKNLKPASAFVVAGMGGSHLAADIMKTLDPMLDMVIHHDYGLPALPDLENRLIILSSYSGNTEEPISAFEEAGKRRLPRAAVSIGEKLIDLARQESVPYVQLPDTGIQPRSALGFSLKALLKLTGRDTEAREATKLATSLRSDEFEEAGNNLAAQLEHSVPVIYASSRNASIAYNWKIKLNETGKIPAFYNTVPELNHNEINGFDRASTTRDLSERFRFLFLEDEEDDPRIGKRMSALASVYKKRGLTTHHIRLMTGKGELYKIFSSLLLADWTAYYSAKLYGVEAEEVPMVEEFKTLIAQ